MVCPFLLVGYNRLEIRCSPSVRFEVGLWNAKNDNSSRSWADAFENLVYVGAAALPTVRAPRLDPGVFAVCAMALATHCHRE